MSAPQEFPQRSYEPPAGAAQILLVRHGQSAPMVIGQEFPMLGGHGNPSLSELGLWQAEQVGARLVNEPISAIYTSNLTRTKQTAAPLATAKGIEPIEVHDLREVFLGEAEGGLFRKWMVEEHPLALKVHADGDWGAIPGAETSDELQARCAPALSEIARRHANQVAAVFVHGGVIGALMAQALGTKAYLHTGSRHTGITHLVITRERWIVRSFNDASHIGTITSDTQL